jgi:L-ascorbate metabolism protein UlaG (beta-lactamase superfamily)
VRITWFGHASFLLEVAGLAIYLDPYAGEPEDYSMPADAILVSHWHFDHCRVELVQRVRQPRTVLLGEREAASEILGLEALKPGDRRSIGPVTVTAVPASSQRTSRFGHEHAEGTTLGFVITGEGRTLYCAADTAQLANVTADIILVPVGGTSTMNAREAAAETLRLRPKVAIPTHWGRIAGSRDDAELFQELVQSQQDIKVVIPEPRVPVDV